MLPDPYGSSLCFVLDDKLAKDKLQTAQAILSLGIAIAKSLGENDMAIVFINLDGEVEFCPPSELLLDTTPLDDALTELLDKGYTDEQLMAYMKGRKLREAILALQGP